MTFDMYQKVCPRNGVREEVAWSALCPRPAERTEHPAVIIDIDEISLDTYGQWPWARTTVARMVENLREYGVAVTGFDVVFAEPDRTSPHQFIKSNPDLDKKVRETISKLHDHDTVFAEAIAGGGVVMGQVAEQKFVHHERLSPKARIGEKKSSFDAPSLPALLSRFRGAVLNLEMLERPAAGIGLFSTIPDDDGIYRKVAMLDRIGDDPKTAQIYPALSLEMIRVAFGGADSMFVKIYDGGIESILLKIAGGGVYEVPTDSKGRIWVHFAEYPTAEKPLYVSAKDVLEKTVDRSLLEGKLAIVGTSAVGLKDIRATPINGQLPGVEVHAQVMETILARSHLKREVANFVKIPFADTHLSVREVEVLSILIGGIIITILVPYMSALLCFLVGIGIFVCLLWTGWYYYLENQILVDFLYPTISIMFIFFNLTYLNYAREEKKRAQVRSAFKHYLSPDLVDQVSEDPEKLTLTGESRELTILFSDIRGFTTISERFNATELTRFINRFLTPMTDVIMKHGGTVDKYMGDAIMAFWNAPLVSPQHHKLACQAALEMQVAVKELNALLQAESENEELAEGQSRRKYMPINIGIGINTGDCSVGNMGSEQRFDYSALGDDVNLASRLEGQSKTYGVDVVLGKNTYEQVKDDFACIELDLIQVKGKTEPVNVFALLGDAKMREEETFHKVQQTVDSMLEAYRAQAWDDAEKHAKALAKLDKSLTELSRLYLGRIQDYRKTPPPEGWDGVFIATTK